MGISKCQIFFCRLLTQYHNLFVRAMQMQNWRGFTECSRRQAEIAKRLFLRMRSVDLLGHSLFLREILDIINILKI